MRQLKWIASLLMILLQRIRLKEILLSLCLFLYTFRLHVICSFPMRVIYFSLKSIDTTVSTEEELNKDAQRICLLALNVRIDRRACVCVFAGAYSANSVFMCGFCSVSDMQNDFLSALSDASFIRRNKLLSKRRIRIVCILSVCSTLNGCEHIVLILH